MKKTTFCCYALLPILKSSSFVRALQLIIAFVYLTSSISKLLDFSRTSLKLNEYAQSFHYTIGNKWTDLLAICLIALEMSIGVLFLRKEISKWIQRLSILLFLLFTLLTLYIASQGSISNCGCFGEIIPLGPWESFGKNVLLLGISILLDNIYKSKCPKNEKTNNQIILPVSLSSLAIIIYIAIFSQPIKDFSKNKVGNILAQTSENLRTPLSIETYSNSMFIGAAKSDYIENLIYHSNNPLVIFVYNGKYEDFQLYTPEFQNAIKNKPQGASTLLLSTTKVPAIKTLSFDFIGLADNNFLKDLIPGQMGLIIVKKGIILEKRQRSFLGQQHLSIITE